VSEINNYIPISRKIFEHQFWCEGRVYSRFEAWLDIVQSTRFEDTELLVGNRLINIKRGQLPVSLRYLAERWKWSTKKVNNYLDLLQHAQMVTKETLKETGQTLLNICNYDRYNFDFEEWKQQKKQEGNSEETLRKQRGNKYNKENKVNKENIECLNARTREHTQENDFEFRKSLFYNQCASLVEKFGKQMVREFFDYWTEPNKSHSRMRFELERTWDLEKRLQTWEKNESIFNKNGTNQRNSKAGGQRPTTDELDTAVEIGIALAEADKNR